MNENKDKNNLCSGGCCCGMHNAARWILAVIILILVYWFGLQVGEFRSSYGYGGMVGRGYGYDDNYNYRGYMMRGGYSYNSAATTTNK